MYERFYGLQERPFDLVPNPRYLFLTTHQREALSNLHYGLTTPRGLTLLLGEAGTGKTTLVQAVLAGLKDSSVRCVLLGNPTLTRAEFYEYLASAFGMGADCGASKTRFLFELRRQAQELAASGVLTALVIDEAQSLPYELLEEVRLLSNIETTTVKLLNVVLAGQPELAERLNEPALRQLKQRLSLRCELRAMNLGETASYIAGRIRIAGGRPERIFTQEAVAAIFTASRGIPRTVNVICDNALLGGFAAAVAPITADVIHEVSRDFDLAAVTPTEAAEEPREDAVRSENRVPREADAAGGEAAEPARAVANRQPHAGTMLGLVTRKRRFSFF
jgi:type II secretory pathway predicted ATPase ExeA